MLYTFFASASATPPPAILPGLRALPCHARRHERGVFASAALAYAVPPRDFRYAALSVRRDAYAMVRLPRATPRFG